ncbi:hypothetical protein [Neptuniibacter sp.]|uniref:hypothetical protein n=1 Tax=Neptuniibacter sp. TaxID=1962643 RepID=UPI002615ADF7|nr:hypothetical protein [Neptuniibacter sp.]MCP4594893.1 hypothetical protein [Neptuniibacter sp.]
MSKHVSEKFLNKLEKEGILVKENGIRFTVSHLNNKGKLLGRDWHKGFVAVTDRRLTLVADGVKFLNIKSSDDRFSAAKFVEDNVACLEVKYNKEPDSKRSLVFHIYSDKVNKIYKKVKKLQEKLQD